MSGTKDEWVWQEGSGEAGLHGAFNEMPDKPGKGPDRSKNLQGQLGFLTGLLNNLAQFKKGGDRSAGIGGLLDMFIPGAGGLFGAVMGFFKKPKVDVGKIDPGNMIATYPAFISLPLSAAPSSMAFGNRMVTAGAGYDVRVDVSPEAATFVTTSVNKVVSRANQLEVGV